jgi:hypothetical protein
VRDLLRLACILLASLLAASTAIAATREQSIAILSGNQVIAMLRQCSRPSPYAGEATWVPRIADVTALEAKLPARLSTERFAALRKAPQGWARQYVGIVRGGRRYLYGNFFPADMLAEAAGSGWKRAPLRVCDGGPAFFGVEFDVAAGHFTHVAFNGGPGMRALPPMPEPDPSR